MRLPLLCLALVAGCTRGVPAEGVQVAAGLYPLAYVAAAVGGPGVAVTELTPPGAEPHDVELSPGQVTAIETADLVLVVRGLQPAVDDAVEDAADRSRALDALSVVPPLGEDPHFWLDPLRLATYAGAVADRLAALDPDGAAGYRERAGVVAAQLRALDLSFTNGLRDCARRDVVTSHAAFGYLAARYGLTQVGISGLSPEAEPPPGRIAEVARHVRRNGVTTVFFEELVSPRVAQTIAREAGATTAVLDPVESGDDYVAAMRGNLAALRTGLGCR